MNFEYPPLEDLPAHDLGRPPSRSSLTGRDAYGGVDEKAAVLLEPIVRNHPLIDGNKRLGWLAAFVFHGLNGIDLDAPEDDAYDLVIGLATGAVDHVEAARHLGSWTRRSVP
ncbi:type II toxin-antitoxin system death-on-curing family toxin [Saccharothrix sp. HUAS TT1]|uniref:type II toxin-antitoxin system death-on-curing family toxin n=1 Tax=unclassified Saccharothrix TaxID=2593673 RepID=UPI00345BAE19